MINNFIDILKFNLYSSLLNNINLNNYLTMSNLVIFSFLYGLLNYYDYIFNLYKHYKYNHIIIEGSRSINYSRSFCRYDNLFSSRFRAIWHFIQKNMESLNISSIKEITDEAANYNDYGDYCENNTKKNNTDMFYVNQEKCLRLYNNIYCKVIYDNSNIQTDNDTNKAKTIIKENITLDIFSDKLSVYAINNFVNDLVIDFEKFQNKSRKDKLYIYSLINSCNSDYDGRNREKTVWEEIEFKSNKTFDKLFFDNKQNFLDKINFFENNEDYYNKYGIPYTLGISLEGHPGTGKTSIIKCLANYLQRHLVIINLNKIKTCDELNNIFYESTYNCNNTTNSINFKKKIYVFEDIDCCMNIVKQRRDKKSNEESDKNSNEESDKNSNEESDKNSNDESNKELNSSYEIDSDSDSDTDSYSNSNNSKKSKMNKRTKFEKLLCKLNKKDDKLTLGHILNLIDGIKECPGRIIILTSNYMDKIDYALRRPGRIDINIKMDYINTQNLNDFYKFYYNENMSDNLLCKYENIKKYSLSPANLTNILISTSKYMFEEALDKYLEN